jgi:hypothetical protein
MSSDLENENHATENIRFSHRRKPDGSFNTTCPLCRQIVGDAKTESELDAFEAQHSCDPADLLSKELSTKE